jgi:DNA-binding CsgD family transcriptional regulator
MRDHLSSADVRALLRLLSELRELGADPGAWRAHLVSNLEALCGASVAVISELRVNANPERAATNCAEAVTPLQSVDHGLDASVREQFYRDLYFIDHRTDDALNAIVPLYGSAFTVSRQNVIGDRHWDRSISVNERFRPLGCDDFVMSMMPVTALGVISSMEVYRDRGTRFGERERLFVDLLHEELARDWNRVEREESARLTPRQRQVLAQLMAGSSEKELAYELNVSPHTVHEHIKAIHRAFGARSRGELLARVAKAKGQGLRTRLIAEQA